MILNNNKLPHLIYTDFLKNDCLENFLKKHLSSNDKLFLLCDSNTYKYCLPVLQSKLKNLYPIKSFQILEGEKSKNLKVCEDIWEFFTQNGVKKDSLIFNLGGGVVTDIGGFCSSVYMRGIKFINIPTSLLGMIDASLGGKTGIDFKNIKNIIGSFKFPEAVFVDVDFLKTLPKREWNAGYFEMIKHGLISNNDYFNELVDNDGSLKIEDAVVKSISIKMDIVISDPLENSNRKALNFGHSVGHAIEAAFLKYSDKSILHGEAILLGMIAEIYISRIKSMMTENEFSRLIKALSPHIPNIKIDKNAIEEIIPFLAYDKKSSKVSSNFTLIAKPGEFKINQSVEMTEVRKSLAFISEILNSC